ncbi:MAG: stalk domain-containing protein [Clostridia bacterium]|nr:stalk domain-containing protein [Clostridia bacterium]
MQLQLTKRREKMAWILVLILCFQMIPASVFSDGGNTVKAQERLSSAVALYIGNSTAFKNNIKMQIDPDNASVKPFISNSRTMVPIRFIAESLGVKVGWDKKTQTVTLTKGSSTIKMIVGNRTMKVNNKNKALDASPVISANRTFLPLRAVSEALGNKVFYHNGLIIISNKDNILNAKTELPLINEIINWFPGNSKLTPKEIAAFDKSVVVLISHGEKETFDSQGSAFCVAKGVFATNYHVIEDGIRFEIITQDGKSHAVEGIVAIDESADIALVKTKELLNIPPLRIGNVSMIEKGDSIVTIGTPEGLQNTISEGIVSAIREEGDTKLIQITAPITHGSSGGPLFNMQGYVVGINTMGYGEGNLNFSVPIDYAKTWIDELLGMNFSEIGVLTQEELNPMDSSVSNSELTSLVNHSINAMQNENANAYMDIRILDDEEKKVREEALQKIFREYDFMYHVEEVRVLSKTKTDAKLRYSYSVRKKSGPDFKDTRFHMKCFLRKENASWKIAYEEIMQIEDLPPLNTPAATSTPVPTATQRPTATPTPVVWTNTQTPAPSSTATPTPTNIPTNTPTPTPTAVNGTYPSWDSNNHSYRIGDRVSYEGHNYECTFAHASNIAWTPVFAVTLWKRI